MTYVIVAGRPAGPRSARAAEDPVQLGARRHAELREHPIEVRPDRPVAEIEAGPDLAVREPLRGKACDLQLLWRQAVERFRSSPAPTRSARSELVLGTIGEIPDPDRVELVTCRPQL